MVLTVTNLLKQSGIKYMVTGGVVVPFYGRVRTTTDIDLLVEYDNVKLKSLVRALNRHGFKVSWVWVEASLRNKTHFTVLDKRSPYRLDVKVLELGEKLGKRVRVKLYGKPTYITSPEDLIVYKLRYGGEIDEEDVRSIILRQKGKLDRQYLRRKAEEQGVQKEKLRKILEKVGEN